jgi:dienelactone hydrolase
MSAMLLATRYDLPFARYRLIAPGVLSGVYPATPYPSYAMLYKVDLADLKRAGVHLTWTKPFAFLDTTLREDGNPIRLEVVIEKPAGNGPFPLAVISHGSTGRGQDPALFTKTFWSQEIADFLLARGWMVAFPQRRGRGKSDGVYDEGLAADRTQGYTCETRISLAGADRALQDLEAAIAALRHRSDVSSGPMLIGGISRGGALSIAYAGMHRNEVAGVLNFVGGWMGEGCQTASEINQTLAGRGGQFDGPTLWLYGRNDPYYSIAHSRSNFDTFAYAGGKAQFLEFDLPGSMGHAVHVHPELWAAVAESRLMPALKLRAETIPATPAIK